MPPLLYITLQRKKRVGQLCLKHIGVPPVAHTRAQNSSVFVTLLFLCFTVCGQRKHLQSTKQMTMIKKPTCKREISKKLASIRDISDGKDKRSSRKYTKKKSQ
jgi:hypothetical protein